MHIDATTTAAFTGHRTYSGEANERLCDAVRSLYADGYRTFLSGMAVGFDMAAAESIITLRNELPDVRLVCVVPFEGHCERFPAAERERYERIVERADCTLTLSPHHTADVYFRRNDFLVDNSSAVIAYFSGAKGGTAYTVHRALRKSSPVLNIWDDLQQIFNFEEADNTI
ncbi:MAG: SLOG family protein [Alistipes sp.]